MIVPRIRGRYVPMPLLMLGHAFLQLALCGLLIYIAIKAAGDAVEWYDYLGVAMLALAVPAFGALSVGFIAMARSDWRALQERGK